MSNSFDETVTRTVKVYLINTETEYNFFMELAADAMNQADNDPEQAAEILAEEIKECLKEAAPDGGMYNELASDALEYVNYKEVAEAFIEDL